jgi:hypothetical protein
MKFISRKKYGIVNGAQGTIKSIIYDNETDYNTNLPSTIIIEFLNYSGPQFFKDNSRKFWIPINPCTVFSRFYKCYRTQYPLKLAKASTITKLQGETLDSGIIDIGISERVCGLAYVALSRFKTIYDFLIEPFPYNRLSNIKASKVLNDRKLENKRLTDLSNLTLNNYLYLLK